MATVPLEHLTEWQREELDEITADLKQRGLAGRNQVFSEVNGAYVLKLDYFTDYNTCRTFKIDMNSGLWVPCDGSNACDPSVIAFREAEAKERPFQCTNNCGRRFRLKHHLQNHLKTRRCVISMVRDQCKKCFNVTINTKRHKYDCPEYKRREKNNNNKRQCVESDDQEY